MQSVEQLRQAWSSAEPPPRQRGVVRAIGVRRGNGVHELATEAEVTVEGGLLGDRWAAGTDPQRHSQITLMNATVANLVAHVHRAGYESGDNFYVDLDLHEEHVSPGTKLRIGTALLRVTDEPHTGCRNFRARFGKDALRWFNLPENRPLHMRGIHAEVLESGRVEVGSVIEVVD